jgi:hypothetical protein
MEEKQSRKIPVQSIAYLLICALGIFAFILIGPYMSGKSLVKMDVKIKKLRIQREKQQLLYPFYQKLLKKLQVEESRILPYPGKSKFPRDKTAKISSIFREIAQKINLETVSITPDVKSIANGSGLFLINILVKGDFFDFRKFLIELGGNPYLQHIEEIKIQQVPGGKEFRLKIWLALD